MKMKVIKNKQLKIKEVKMTCDRYFDPPISEPLQSLGKNFFMLISGSPKSGKTNCIISLLRDENAFFRRFDKIYWFSPSTATIGTLPIDEDNQFDEYDPELIEFLIDEINDDEFTQNDDVLMVFDDLISDIQADNTFMKLAFNRRHQIPKGSLNIIVISQKMNALKKKIRSGLSSVILFNPSTVGEWKDITDEFITLDRKDIKLLRKIAFRKPHNFIFINLMEGNNNNRYFPNFNKLIVDSE